jgi:signal transduction histidine kinase
LDSRNAADLGLLVLAAGAVALVIRAGRGQAAKTPRGRLRELGWRAGLLLLAVSAMSASSMPFSRHRMSWWLIVIAALGTAAWLLRPRLAGWIVPAGLIAAGFYGLLAIGPELYLTLPQAYGLVLLGGWLAWWHALAQAPRTRRRLLGRLAQPERASQRWAVLLLPVAMMAAMLTNPEIWWYGVWAELAAVGWIVLLPVAAFLLARRSPDVAATLAVAGLAVIGLTGLYLLVTSQVAWDLSDPSYGAIRFGLFYVSGQSASYLPIVQGLAFVGLAAWLTPRAAPGLMRMAGWAGDTELVHRVQRLTETRAVSVDSAAADLRRLERDLHDGAQARLVALGMNLRALERLIPASPEAALALVAEARETSARALTELRELVRGVHPPVLADRGLADAIRALALDSPLRVQTDLDLPGRLPAPVETACYFAVAEVLTNAAKHSGAREAQIVAGHAAGMLRICITDFGGGGADPAVGTGLAGVERRLATFDGILAVSSPVGGPTMVALEVPCTLSQSSGSP